jgi:hypothetical protein
MPFSRSIAFVVVASDSGFILNPKRFTNILFEFKNSLAQKLVSFSLGAGNAESFVKPPLLSFSQ